MNGIGLRIKCVAHLNLLRGKFAIQILVIEPVNFLGALQNKPPKVFTHPQTQSPECTSSPTVSVMTGLFWPGIRKRLSWSASTSITRSRPSRVA